VYFLKGFFLRYVLDCGRPGNAIGGSSVFGVGFLIVNFSDCFEGGGGDGDGGDGDGFLTRNILSI
jgi:hypothetical protein